MSFFVDEYTFAIDSTHRAVLSAGVTGGQSFGAPGGGFRVAGTLGDGGLLAALDEAGNALWQKSYIIAGHVVRFLTGVRCDDGDLMLHGSLVVTPDHNEALIVRVSSDGNIRWANTYSRDRTRINVRLVKGPKDTYYFAGWYNEQGTTDDVEVIKIDGAGQFLAAVNIHSDGDDQINTLIPYNDGCVLVGGSSASGPFTSFLIAFDGNLKVIWKRILGDGNFQQIFAIAQTGPQQFVIFGETSDARKPFIATFSPADTIVKARVFDLQPGAVFSNHRLLMTTGSFYLSAITQAFATTSIVARFDPQLNLLWQRSLSPPGNAIVTDLANSEDGADGLVVCGFVTAGKEGTSSLPVSLLAYTDGELASCVTKELSRPEPQPVGFDVTDWRVDVTDVKMIVSTQVVDVRPQPSVRSEICPAGTSIDLESASIQSRWIYLQAAGSDFSDQTVAGIQLRWDLLHRLGDEHFPKGNLAAPGGPWAATIGFNRPDDFVRIYRTELRSDYGLDVKFGLPPSSLFESGSVREWLYEDLVPASGRVTDVSIRFLDVTQYDTLRATIDPHNSAQQFIASYTGVIDARAVGKLAFSVSFTLAPGNLVPGHLRVEALTLPDPLDNASRTIGCRRTFAAGTNAQVVCENIESVRFDYSVTAPVALHIATYEDFLHASSDRREWQKIGDFSLDDGNSDADANVFRRLENPPKVAVDGIWPKFRRVADPGVFRVNAQNYRDRWTAANGLKQGVITYLDASRTDVKANVVVASSDPVPNDSAMELSYLDLLNFVALDHHVGRMLGTAAIDTSVADPTKQFIYLMQYVTEAPLAHEAPARNLHCYMTPPLRITDYKLPPAPVINLSFGLPPEECEGTTTALTDANGYAVFDQVRFVNLNRAPFRYELPIESFFQTSSEFNLCDETVPVSYGISYGPGPAGSGNEVRPEISNNRDWFDPAGVEEVAQIPERSANPVYTHQERSAGIHHYWLYCISWFSRISIASNEVQTDVTQFAPRNTLLPPANLAVQLIQKEDPRIFTSLDEQNRLMQLPAGDQTLVRATFDWNHVQNQAYFRADTVELYFRKEPAAVVRGEILSVSEDAATHTATIVTKPYLIASVNPPETVQPEITAADVQVQRFAGSRLSVMGRSWRIESVPVSGLNPTIVVKQIRTTASIDADHDNSYCTVETWSSPHPGDRFLIAENLDNPGVWDTKLAKEVSLVHFSPPHFETIIHNDGQTRTVYIGGLTASATVQEIADLDPNIHTFVPPGGPASVPSGAYTVTFPNTNLPPIADPDVQFFEGVVRTPDVNSNIKVLRVWNIKQSGADLVLTVFDGEFGLRRNLSSGLFTLDNAGAFVPVAGYVPVRTGIVTANLHPSYVVNLRADLGGGRNFGEPAMLPARGEGSRQTIMTARARENATTPAMTSPMARPAVIVAQELHDPVAPAPPIGPLFATRPMFDKKATFTFDVEVHDPESLIFYKGNDRAVLDQLYEPATVRSILAALDSQSDFDKTFAAQRWSDLVNMVTDANGLFIEHVGGGFRFPIPNNPGYVIPDPQLDPPVNPFVNNNTPPGSSSIVPGTMRTMQSVVKEAIEKGFVALTEIPVVYRQLTDKSVQTSGRPPKLRNPAGERLAPSDPQYDPWPMAVRFEKNTNGDVLKFGDAGYGNAANTKWVRFTDYTLDGASKNLYFFFGVELSNTLRMSGRSGVTGPVTLVNSSPPAAPGIRDISIRSADPGFDTRAAVVLAVNPYLASDDVVSLRIYRALDASAAQSVRSMVLVKTAAVGDELIDDFADLDPQPFGDPIYYRVVALRRFTNELGHAELAPSWPSEARMVRLIDEAVPPAPELAYALGTPVVGTTVELPGVTLTWKRTAWNPRYHVFKRNPRGNWLKVSTLATNDSIIILDLATTDLGTNVLTKRNAEGKTLYHQFKVVTENSSGLLSTEEKPLVI